MGLLKWAPGYINLVPHEADICVTHTIIEHNVVVVFNWRSFTFSFSINLKNFTATEKPVVETGKPYMKNNTRDMLLHTHGKQLPPGLTLIIIISPLECVGFPGHDKRLP